jgi:4-hydroxy-3-methylbut-2-enyl diphosphate reductase
VTDEDEYFPPPRNIRELQAAIDMAITAMCGASIMNTPGMDDRALAASAVLEALSIS